MVEGGKEEETQGKAAAELWSDAVTFLPGQAAVSILTEHSGSRDTKKLKQGTNVDHNLSLRLQVHTHKLYLFNHLKGR